MSLKFSWSNLYPNQHTPGCFWWPLAEAFGSPNVQWCEENLCAFVSQPANTWSNLAYLVTTALMLLDVGTLPRAVSKSGASPGTLTRQMLILYPYMNFVCGVLSLIYHLSNIYPTQVLDFVGMFAVTGWCMAANLIRSRTGLTTTNSAKRFISCTMVSVIFATHVLYTHYIKIQVLVMGAIVVIMASDLLLCRTVDLRQGRGYGMYWTSLFFLTIAAIASFTDHKRIFCNPKDHIVQGHAIWHVLSAIALYCLWKHYLRRGY